MNATLRRIWGMTYRHACLYRKSWPRLLELGYWPTLEMLIWGMTARFLYLRGGTGWLLAGALLGGVLLWEVALRTQMGMAMSFLEEVWSRNLAHVFVSPLQTWELVASLMVVSLLRLAAGMLPAVGVAWLLYRFDIFAFGPVLVLFFINLVVMGWAISFGVMALILRHGTGAESLAWGLLAGLTPLCAVYYPTEVIPMPWRVASLVLPASHVFEGMRAALHGNIEWRQLGIAAALNVTWLAALATVFARELEAARSRGALLTIGE